MRLGASFTPSPVIATILPLALMALTMATLFSGETRAKTRTCSTLSWSSSGVQASISAPVMHWSGEEAMSSSLAMAKAVSRWSPVIMMVVMPA